MGTWLIGLSLTGAGFVMGRVLMAILVATHRTDLRSPVPKGREGGPIVATFPPPPSRVVAGQGGSAGLTAGASLRLSPH